MQYLQLRYFLCTCVPLKELNCILRRCTFLCKNVSQLRLQIHSHIIYVESMIHRKIRSTRQDQIKFLMIRFSVVFCIQILEAGTEPFHRSVSERSEQPGFKLLLITKQLCWMAEVSKSDQISLSRGLFQPLGWETLSEQDMVIICK